MADKEQKYKKDLMLSYCRVALTFGLVAVDYLLKQREDRSIRLIDTDGKIKEVFLNG